MDSNPIKIDYTIIADGYIMTFDESKQKLIFVDPDTILSKSVEDNSIPQDFIDKLGVDLDDKINLDSGEF